MGWKNVKDYFRIEHIVSVTQAGICIGSPYIHDIIVLGPHGEIRKGGEDYPHNADLRRYLREFRQEPAKLRELIEAPDTFSASIQVFTFKGGEVIEKRCEALGWPNPTHDGQLQYDNTFSTDKAKVVRWAKESRRCSIINQVRCLAEVARELAQHQGWLAEAVADLEKLEKDFPNHPLP